MILTLIKSRKLLLLPCCLLILNGCASNTKQLIISPQITTKFANIYSQVHANINSLDMRASTHIVQILRDDKAAKLTSSTSSIAMEVEKSLRDIFNQQGLVITNTKTESKIDITILIDTALISVKQDLMKYQANNSISLRFQIKNADKTLTKSFNSHGKSNGPLNADLAVLERDFNQQLTKLIQQIADDNEIQAFITQ